MTEVRTISFGGSDGCVADTCVSDARAWCRHTATDAHLDPSTLVDDVELIVSELVSNAVRAHAGDLSLTLVIDEHHVEIEVGDDAPGAPTPLTAAARDTHGRGLRIVEAVAADWGVRPTPTGKCVWATLDADHLLTA